MSQHNHIHHYSNPAYVQNAAVDFDYSDHNIDDPVYPPIDRHRNRPRYYNEPIPPEPPIYRIIAPQYDPRYDDQEDTWICWCRQDARDNTPAPRGRPRRRGPPANQDTDSDSDADHTACCVCCWQTSSQGPGYQYQSQGMRRRHSHSHRRHHNHNYNHRNRDREQRQSQNQRQGQTQTQTQMQTQTQSQTQNQDQDQSQRQEIHIHHRPPTPAADPRGGPCRAHRCAHDHKYNRHPYGPPAPVIVMDQGCGRNRYCLS